MVQTKNKPRKQLSKKQRDAIKKKAAQKAERKYMRTKFGKEISTQRYTLKESLNKLANEYYRVMQQYGGEPNKCPGKRTMMPACGKVTLADWTTRRNKPKEVKVPKPKKVRVPYTAPLVIPPKGAK